MGRRQLLTNEERQLLLGVPRDPDDLARHYTFTRSDQELVSSRRGAANRLGFAVQLALLRHPGRALAQIDEPVDALVAWLAAHLVVPATAFIEYARRLQTMTDHASILAACLGLRPAVSTDLPLMIEAAAQCAWSTDRGHPIVAGVIAALQARKIILPAPARIERAAIAGRARARKRATDALLAELSAEQITKIDKLLAVDSSTGLSRFAWLKNLPASPKADHIEELIDRLRAVRDIGLAPETETRIHEDRFRQLVREADISEARQLERLAVHRRRAIQVALLLALESRLTDAALDMADKLIGRMFARAKNAQEKSYVASTKDVGRLMRLFRATIAALGVAQESERDGFAVVDEAVGWPKLLKARSEIEALADLAEEDPLVRAADRYLTQVGHLVLRTYCYKTGIRKNQSSVAPRRGRPRRRGGVAAAAGGGGASVGGGWPAGTCRTNGGSATPTALNTAPEQPGACARSTNRFERCSTVSSSTRSRSRTISPHSALTPAAVSRSSSSLRTSSARKEQNRCPAIAASD